MARGAISYSTGILTGSNICYQLIGVIRTALKAYISNGEAAWEDYDIINNTPGTSSYMMHSVGDRTLGSGALKGDAELYIHLYESGSNIVIKCNRDWSQVSHTGNGNGSTSYFTVTATDSLEYWMVCNEYCFAIVVHQQGYWSQILGGQLIRPYASGVNGIARLSVASSGTGTITLTVDRDCTSTLKVGQGAILMNQTPDGQALKSSYINIVTITNITSGSITVSGVSNTPFEIGSLIGLDPCPSYAVAYNGYVNNVYPCTLRNGAETTASLGVAGYGSFTEADEDPGFDGTYAACPCWANSGTAPLGYRGDFGDHFLLFALGLQADKDIMRVDFDDTKKYKIFPSLGVGSASWCPGFGPGAT